MIASDKGSSSLLIGDEKGPIASIEIPDAIFCEIYKCTMSRRACIKRQKIARKVSRKDAQMYTPGYHDPNCRDCEQGKEIAQSLKLKAQSKKDRQMINQRAEIEEFIRQVCEAEHITVKDLKGGKKYGAYSIARYKTVVGLRDEYKLTFQKIGDLIGSSLAGAQRIYNKKPKLSVPAPPPRKKPKDTKAPEKPSSENVIQVDFSDYPGELERLKKIAKEELRTPEAQLIYWIRKHVR